MKKFFAITAISLMTLSTFAGAGCGSCSGGKDKAKDSKAKEKTSIISTITVSNKDCSGGGCDKDKGEKKEIKK